MQIHIHIVYRIAYLCISRIAAERTKHFLKLSEVCDALCGLLEQRVHGGSRGGDSGRLLLFWGQDGGVSLAGVQPGQQVVKPLLLLRLVVGRRIRQLKIPVIKN